jgi:hypothetical protein
VHVSALGAVVAVEAPTQVVADQVRTWWSRCLAPESARPDATVALPNTELPLTAPLAQKLTHEINLRAIDAGAGSLVMLHAGAVADAGGDTIGLVAESGVGKTTATVALARSGWGYVTDETLAIEPDATVVPLAKPLALVNGTTAKTIVGPDQLGLARTYGSLRLRHLLLLDRDPHHDGTPTVTEVPLLAALDVLVGHSSALVRLRRPLQALASLVTVCGGLHRVTYREADDLAPVLGALTDDAEGEHGCAAHWWRDPLGDPAGLPQLGADVRDIVGTPDGALALVNHAPVRLSPVGVIIWGHAAAGRAETDVVRELSGLRPDGQSVPTLVRETMQALQDVGALRAQ